MDKFDKILAKAEDLPVLPHIGMEILNLIEDKFSVPADFEAIIESDQVLTLKILKMANSAYYGYAREIINVKDAVVILGLDTIKSLVLSMLTRQMLSKDLHTYGLKKGELWSHSLAVAMTARSIAKIMKLSNHEKFFVAGLLHDVGKILLDITLKNYVDNLKFQVNEGKVDFIEAELRIAGIDHALIGSKLIEIWNLPDFLVNSVRYHHTSSKAPANFKTDAYIIDVANRLSYQVAPGSSVDFRVDKNVMPEEYGKLGLTSANIEGVLDSIRTSLDALQLTE